MVVVVEEEVKEGGRRERWQGSHREHGVFIELHRLLQILDLRLAHTAILVLSARESIFKKAVLT